MKVCAQSMAFQKSMGWRISDKKAMKRMAPE